MRKKNIFGILAAAVMSVFAFKVFRNRQDKIKNRKRGK